MKIPDKDDPGGDKEGALPLKKVLEALARQDISIDPEHPSEGDCIVLTSDVVCESHFLKDPVGGLMIRYLSRKFGVPLIDIYFFERIEEERRRPPKH